MVGIINPVFFIGVVENNIDQRLEGRVQVRAFGFHGSNQEIPTEMLPWATPISGGYELTPPIPPLNSWVFGLFLDGMAAQQPMLLGILPTQYITPINPELNGYGAIPVNDYELLAQGSRPSDYGQPSNSRLARGEDIEKTYNASLEVTRVKDLPIPGTTDDTWSEPGSAYNTQYPFNRVIETAGGHSIELDDTPGAERIMINHTSGAYVQIDAKGSTTHKSTGDKFDINEEGQYVYVGGRSVICVEGDAHVYVKGNKYEEIIGDLKQVVHGNYEISTGGQMNLNASDELQMRAARLTGEAKVENVSFKSGKEIAMSAGKGIHLTGAEIINIKSPILNSKTDSFNVEAGDTINMKSDTIKINGGGKISIKGSTVAIDDIVKMANGESDDADGVEGEPIAASGAKLSEPASKMANIYSINSASASGGGGYAGNDMGEDVPVTYTSSCSSNLVEEVKKHEKFEPNAYWDKKQYSVGYGSYTSNPNEVVTEEEATKRLEARLSSDRAKISEFGKQHGYNWNDCQIDALTSFTYNLGYGNATNMNGFIGLTGNGTRTNEEIAEKMLEYNKSGGEVLGGLTLRRESESNWFKQGTNGGAVDENAATSTDVPITDTTSGSMV